MRQLQYQLKSKIAPLYLVTSPLGLRGAHWRPLDLPLLTKLDGTSLEEKYMAQAVRELSEFFDGQRKTFEITLDIEGTEFQKRVWEELCKIPYGKTLSYKDVAERVGTQGIRAVGTANGRNPISIIVPCHRVIATGGGLGGYAGGLPVKRFLLNLEQDQQGELF